jgi:hypothetical protein
VAALLTVLLLLQQLLPCWVRLQRCRSWRGEQRD